MDWFVSPAGDDSAGNGSLASPWKTIQKAAGIATSGDTIYVREGTYRETVTPAHDGASGSPIVFRPYQDETVVISGCDVLTGWTETGDGVWEAPMNWSLAEYRNQLFVNDAPMTKARWPNVSDDDPLTPEGAVFDRTSSNMAQAKAAGGFPAGWTATALDGAAIWVMADKKWRAWNSGITAYDPGTGIASFQEVTQVWWVENMNPGNQGPYGDGYFFLSGSRGLLDAPGEWWHDDANKKMLLIPPSGVDPSSPGTVISAKRRDFGFILDNRSHIHLEDLIFRGTAASLAQAQSCRLIRLKFCDFDFREGETHFTRSPYYQSTGVIISGRGNAVRDSEFTRCTDAGVTILGEDNELVNCYLHEVDYGGYDGGPINLGGMRNLVSHNTVERAARKGINPGGLSNLIQYNFVKEIGLVTRDQAAIYAGGFDGGNTVIRYNWIDVGNGNPESHASGIYMDNWHQNVVVHHNIVWNATNGTGLQPNRPGHYDIWAHNSVQGKISTSYGPWQGQETLFGTFLHNNWATGLIDSGDWATYSKEGNQQASLNLDFSSGVPVPTGDPSGCDAGSFLPGVNDSYAGSRPDIGAIEDGVLDWRAGHDFAHPPNAVYEPPAFYYRNYVVNGGFDYQRVNYTPKLDWFYGWTQTGLAVSAVEYHAGFNFPAADERNSIHGNSLHLQGNADDGVEQTIADLPIGRFFLAAYVRLVSPETPLADVKLSVFRAGEEIASELATSVSLSGDQKWRLVKTPFTQYGTGHVTIRITKLGEGEAYVDNIGVVPRYFDDPFDIPLPPVSDLPIQNGLVLHLDASKISGLEDGDPVNTWINLASEGNDATATNDQRPLLVQNALNAKPVVRFDGSDDWLNVGTIRSDLGAVDCFIVVQSADTDDGKWQRIISCYDTGTDDYLAPNWSYSRPNSSGDPIAFDPTLVTISHDSGRHIANLKLARHGIGLWGYYGGDIAEVALFDRKLRDWERNEIGFHLTQKYGFAKGAYVDPSSDTDGDGMGYTAELIAGTLPNDPTSLFRVRPDLAAGSGQSVFRLRWDSVNGRNYTVMRCFDLRNPDWQEIAQFTGDSFEKLFTEEIQGQTQAFYRVVVTQP